MRATEKTAPAGRYQIRVAELRAATAQDADRISAERAFLEGENLQAEATADTLAQAIKKYDEAPRLWRSVGEGIIRLTRGLMYAGAGRVVVSLWDVDDEATAQLMTGFYKRC